MKPDLEETTCINIYCACPVLRLGDACCDDCRLADPKDDVECNCGHARCAAEEI